MSLYFMTRAGFDATKAADVQRKLGIVSPGSLYSNYASTHPSTPERAANLDLALQEVVEKMARNESLVPTNLENPSGQGSVQVADVQKILDQRTKPTEDIQASVKRSELPSTNHNSSVNRFDASHSNSILAAKTDCQNVCILSSIRRSRRKVRNHA